MAYLIELGGGGKITLKAAVVVMAGKKRKINLGRVSAEVGRRFCSRLDELAGVRQLGERPGADLSRWITDLSDAVRERLVALELIDPPTKKTITTLGEMLAEIFRSLRVKPQTRVVYGQTRDGLEAFFGASTPAASIGPLDAEKYRQRLVTDELAQATIAKRVKTARAFFRLGLRWKMIAENPFEGVRAGGQTNRERMVYVPAETIGKVLAAAGGTEWRALIALARFGGLRCPSEHFALRWGDIDWENGQILVRSAKTEGKEGRECRMVPLFSELVAILTQLHAEAEEGAEYIFSKLRRPGVNLRTQFERYITRAGVAPWPRLFQNLRSSRATELAEHFPGHVAAQWLGHTEAVARGHYLQVRDSDFAAARALPNSLARDPNRAPAAGDTACPGVTKTNGQDAQVSKTQQGALVGAPCQNKPMTPMGSELRAVSAAKCENHAGEGPESGTAEGEIAYLARVWSVLSAEVRAEILTLARGSRTPDRQTASGEGEGR